MLGNCSQEEWLKAITKIGITGFTDKNLLDLHEIYDSDKSGDVDYKEFIGALYGNTSISKKGDGEEKEGRRDESDNRREKTSKKAYLQVEGYNIIFILELSKS